MSDSSGAVTAPSTIPLDATSLTRLGLALVAGALLKAGFTGDQASAIVGGALALATGIWHLYKNRQVQKALATAMASPAVPVVTPAGLKVPPAAVAIFAVFFLTGVIFMLPGCKTAPLLPPTTEAAFVEGDTALDATFNTAAKLYLGALPNMSPAVHDKLKPEMQRAYKLVQAVDGGQVLSGETSIAQEIKDATDLSALVKAALQP